MKLIEKDAVAAEIKRRIANLDKLGNRLYIETNFPEQYRLIHGYESVLSFIHTLEVKEVDLEKYYHEFLQKEWFGNPHVRTVSEMMSFTAKHFFELGLKSKSSYVGIPNIDDTLKEMGVDPDSNIDSMQEEPVSVWHDANKEEPKKDKAFATIDSDGVMCAEYHVFEGGLTFKQIKQMDDIVKWAYVEDLIPKN